MARTYSRRFKVRQYEVDSYGHVNNSVYGNYLQETAVEASADAGYGMDWYTAQGTTWVIRKLTIRYLAPATFGDEVEVKTWIAQVRRVRALREYEIKRVVDGQALVRARADWVYVDAESGQPARLPQAVVEGFSPANELPRMEVRLRKRRVLEDSYKYRSYRKVQIYELDAGQHVNHVNYLRWVEQAYFDAVSLALNQRSNKLADELIVLQGGHEIEYFLPALEGDSIEIVSWVSEMANVRGAWLHEIYNVESGQLLARDYSLGVFPDRKLKPTPPPAQQLNRVISGPDNQ